MEPITTEPLTTEPLTTEPLTMEPCGCSLTRTAREPAAGWKNGQGRQAAAPSPATSLGPPAAGGQGRSHGCLVASGTRKEAQVSLAR
ncbi:uncharacterized protein [Bos taurus]|uniref:uncharacterized protein isoform X3 n=1 Tax=Bos taurus TaxID=9913 RepID=UPI0028CB8632|nr:uncharacterized protein LOC132343259 isoform X3 [Bos taurus]